MLQVEKRPFDEGDRLAVGGTGHRAGAGLSVVDGSPLPVFGMDGVVGQPLDVFGQTVGVEVLHRSHDAAMEPAPSLPEQAAVGYFESQGMLEGVLPIWEQARFV